MVSTNNNDNTTRTGLLTSIVPILAKLNTDKFPILNYSNSDSYYQEAII